MPPPFPPFAFISVPLTGLFCFTLRSPFLFCSVGDLDTGLSGHYTAICAELGWAVDQAKLAELEKKTSEELKSLEEKITDAIENLGDSEVREALTAKAEFLCKVGAPKEERVLAFKVG